MSRPLSEKDKIFVEEYLVSLNASKAYRKMGGSEKTAGQAGYHKLRDPRIQKAIQKSMEERNRRTHVDQDRVIRELAKIGYASIKSVVKHWDNATMTLRDSDEISEEDAAAVKSVEWTMNEMGMKVKVEMHSKIDALKILKEHTTPPKGEKEVDPIEQARVICELAKEMAATMGMRLSP